MTPTNILNRASSYIGIARPRSRTRQQNPPSRFSNINPQLAQTYQRTVAATRALRLNVVNRFQESRVGRFIQAPLNKIRSSFKFMDEYRYP